VAANRARPAEQTVLPAWRIDARDGLNAAEQGINADLAAAAEDIRAAMAGGEAPSPERLAEEALPPFARDATVAKRGGHAWTLNRDGAVIGYLGATGDPTIARSLLLKLSPGEVDGHDHAPAAAVWAHASAGTVARLSDEALIAAGWRQVISHYDASVTREQR
jgi:hypothetical protein